jgi:hypothetical protein
MRRDPSGTAPTFCARASDYWVAETKGRKTQTESNDEGKWVDRQRDDARENVSLREEKMEICPDLLGEIAVEH